ncbi:unnamed protein product [Prorocentrum cordatum]|uniref:Peroxisomal membrane protein PEX16 n=1 Tax=Prorocentrum cordatum TaxID=2364126 RepID=A0ABN9SR10_9DINO|nr:unnamed protein product [Polarella glacialis]
MVGGAQRRMPYSVREAIMHVPAFILAQMARYFAQEAFAAYGKLPEWFHLQAVVEDWWKGYRQLFPCRKHVGLVVVAVLHPVERRWLNVVLRGLPFGLGAAVNQFNRAPAVLTAAARRILFIMCAHYVDDNGILELTGLHGDGPAAFQRLCRLAGAHLPAKKRKPETAMPVLLRALTDLASIINDCAVAYGPKPGAREAFEKEMALVWERGELTSGQASHLRVVLSWLDSSCIGRLCRAALSALVARQYYDGTTAIPERSNLHASRRYLQAAVRYAPATPLPLLAPPRRPI